MADTRQLRQVIAERDALANEVRRLKSALHDATDLETPEMIAAHKRIIHAMRMIELANSPMRAGGDGHATGKPSSRPPGRQQCPGAVACVIILTHSMEDVARCPERMARYAALVRLIAAGKLTHADAMPEMDYLANRIEHAWQVVKERKERKESIESMGGKDVSGQPRTHDGKYATGPDTRRLADKASAVVSIG